MIAPLLSLLAALALELVPEACEADGALEAFSAHTAAHLAAWRHP